MPRLSLLRTFVVFPALSVAASLTAAVTEPLLVGARGEGVFPRTAVWWESEGSPDEPRSLYLAQLRARLK